jgi:hypothetical protein
VLKYELRQPDENGHVVVAMPWSAEPLTAGMQADVMVVWATSFDTFTSKHRRFLVVNTGRNVNIPDDARWLGTVTSSTGIVWHVFDEGWWES